ncbi:hypothetical protein E2C01_060464 [Portunus trituberculatus]|uniref:Uncharacterized protein n=1 Tax=Portunus trituberculatus TaxID=210409 RepID=A0A5B7HBH7_PORTR|nr:hypothetical protein [Portunus trituberculatus]
MEGHWDGHPGSRKWGSGMWSPSMPHTQHIDTPLLPTLMWSRGGEDRETEYPALCKVTALKGKAPRGKAINALSLTDRGLNMSGHQYGGKAGAGTRYTVTKHGPAQLGDLPPPPI